jgi:hypothetical protein
VTLLAKVGSFDTGTGAAASNVVVTGVGFQGKVLKLWWSGRTGSADAVGSANIQRGIGWAVSTTSRRAVSSRAEDAQATIDTGRSNYDTACVVVQSPTNPATIDGLLDFVSFDADGFTLVVDDQFTASYRIHYQVLGGDDLTDVAIGTIAAVGEVVTGLGFQPDCVEFMSGNTGTPNAPQGGGEMSYGAAISAAEQAVWYGDSVSGGATSASINYCRAGEIWANSSASVINSRANFVSMDADGFTIDYAELGSAQAIYYLAMRGGRYALGSLLTATNTTPFSETGLGIGTPVTVMFVSAGKVEDAVDTPSANERWIMGAATGAGEQRAMGTWDESGVADSECATAVEHDAVFVNIATTDAVQSIMALASMDADGFTVAMNPADAGNQFVWYVAVGSNEPALVEPVLSAPTPSGTIGTQTTATIGATTDQNSGTFYAVVGTGSDVVGITEVEIKAGQIAGGAAATASGNSAVTTTSPSVGVTGLTLGTTYVYAAVQNNASGDSNIVTGSFTTAPAAPSSRPPPSSGRRIATLLLT